VGSKKMGRLASVGAHTFRSKVQLLNQANQSSTCRTTVPQAVVAILDLSGGSELVWTYDSTTRRVTVSKGEPRKG
jgi:hypothetical protein